MQVQGWTVEFNATLVRQNASLAQTALDVLREQLEGIVAQVPAARVAELRRILIWIERESPGEEQQLVHHPTGSTWPEKHGYPDAKRGSIAIRNAKYFVDRRNTQPSVVMHELAHAYHEVVLGFDDRLIINAYENAFRSGLYQSVAARIGQPRRAYALTNHKEYFAELTEAFFGTNDFYPFNRAELRGYDPVGFAAVRAVWEDAVPVVLSEVKGIGPACESVLVASPGSDRAARLTVRNAGHHPVKLVWIDFKGERRPNLTIAAGALGTLRTFVGHNFLIVDANDQCVATATVRGPVSWIDVLP